MTLGCQGRSYIEGAYGTWTPYDLGPYGSLVAHREPYGLKVVKLPIRALQGQLGYPVALVAWNAYFCYTLYF